MFNSKKDNWISVVETDLQDDWSAVWCKIATSLAKTLIGSLCNHQWRQLTRHANHMGAEPANVFHLKLNLQLYDVEEDENETQEDNRSHGTNQKRPSEKVTTMSRAFRNR